VPSTLIPVTNHRDLMIDAYRNVLDITTSAGTVQQFNLTTQTFMGPLQVVGGGGAPQQIGTSLAGADFTADGTALLVAETQSAGGQEVLHRINMTNNTLNNIYYPSIPGEGGWSLALGPGTKGLLDDIAANGGPGPLRQFDAVTGAETFRNDSPGVYGGGVGSGSVIRRSADRSVLLVADGGRPASCSPTARRPTPSPTPSSWGRR
jgi:hypothetical protein